MDITKQLVQGTCHLTCNGAFTFNDHPEFRAILDGFADASVQHVVMHLAGVEFVDSAALGMLLLALDESEKQKKPLTLQGAVGQVKKMFDMANFHTLFKIEP